MIKKEGVIKLFYKVMYELTIRTIIRGPLGSKINYFLRKRSSRIVIKKIDNFKMMLDIKNDLGLSKELFLRNKREIYLTDYLKNSNILRDGDICLDIGANKGYYVLIESKIVGSKGKIYAVEPVSENFNYLSKNIKLNSLKNVELFKLALGDKNRNAKINIAYKHNWSSLKPIKNEEIIRTEDIIESTIDTFLEDKKIPTLIRMDVEGYEYKIIKGMKKSLKNNIKILMEIHPHLIDEKDIREMFKILKENDYKVKLVIFDPPEKILTSDGNMNPFLMFFNKKLGIENNYGFLNMNSEELLDWLLMNKNCPHILFEKAKIKD
ncbi:MAG: FkbM family methyltransferase [Thermoplasmatales archaeon]|nr:FkbM family methyltransferase [Thermoplasmatales archaeon]